MGAGDRVRLFYVDTIVVDRGKRWRRSCSKALKPRVVAKRLELDASVAEVGRQHGLNANMMFLWRRDPRFGAGRDTPEFPSVEVRPAEFRATFERVIANAKGQVEIALSSGHRLTLPGAFNLDVLPRLVMGLPTP